MSEVVEEIKLTGKQKAFAEHYLGDAHFNATKAAGLAGYKGVNGTLRVVGWENLTKPNIRAYIAERLADLTMPANEVLVRLTEHATASLADVLDDEGCFDLAKARQNGKDHLLKKLKVRYDKEGATHEFEIHDPQAALVHLGRYHKLFTDRAEVEMNVTDTRVVRPISTGESV